MLVKGCQFDFLIILRFKKLICIKGFLCKYFLKLSSKKSFEKSHSYFLSIFIILELPICKIESTESTWKRSEEKGGRGWDKSKQLSKNGNIKRLRFPFPVSHSHSWVKHYRRVGLKALRTCVPLERKNESLQNKQETPQKKREKNLT